MKKGISILVLTALVAVGAFAQIDMSAGLGGNFSASFDSLKFDGDPAMKSKFIGGGLFAFFDATFAEVNIGMQLGGMNMAAGDDDYDDDSMNATYLTFGVLGKYPIDLGGLTVFPLIGIQMDIGVGLKYDGDDVFEDSSDRAEFMNRFWIKLGGGADINISDQLYVRPSLLYGINFGTKLYRDMKDVHDDFSSFHHGFDLRVAVGFRF